MAVCAPHIRLVRHIGITPSVLTPPVNTSRRSSVVERVIGNDEVESSILSGGTIKSKT
jgi:hypothetical protein